MNCICSGAKACKTIFCFDLQISVIQKRLLKDVLKSFANLQVNSVFQVRVFYHNSKCLMCCW